MVLSFFPPNQASNLHSVGAQMQLLTAAMIKLASVSTETAYIHLTLLRYIFSTRLTPPTLRHVDNIPLVVHRSYRHTLAFAQAHRQQPHRIVCDQESEDARRTRMAAEEVEEPVLDAVKKERFVRFVGGKQRLAKNIVVEHDVAASLDDFLSLFGGGGLGTSSSAKSVVHLRTFGTVDIIRAVLIATRDFPHVVSMQVSSRVFYALAECFCRGSQERWEFIYCGLD